MRWDKMKKIVVLREVQGGKLSVAGKRWPEGSLASSESCLQFATAKILSTKNRTLKLIVSDKDIDFFLGENVHNVWLVVIR